MKINKLVFAVLIFALNIIIFYQLVEASDIKDSVVKVFTTSNRMDFYQPWQSKGNRQVTGSGCIIEGKKILTNAHVVTNQTFIQVRKYSDPKKYTARLLAIAHECDLALLTVDDEGFFEGITPLKLGELPFLQDTVSVMGYPMGGDKLSITEGVVSRIEIRPYAHSNWNLLAVQIDAAINPGNSGGPVLQDGKLVGIAMQVAVKAQNIGYIIPVPVIKHFFNDIEDESYDGFPVLGINFGGTENPAMKEYYKINKDAAGVVIEHVMPFSPADNILKEGDIVLALDGVEVAEDGTFSFRDTERLFFSYLITKKQIGDMINIRFVRDAKIREKDIKLKKYIGPVPGPYFYRKPTYYIYGGLVFSVLSNDLLNHWGEQWGKGPFLYNEYRFGTGRLNLDKRKQVVVLLNVLPDNVNVGYHSINNEVVDKVNGEKINSFKQLVGVLNNQKDKFAFIETKTKSKIIINNEKIDEANERILNRYSIPAQYSDDVSEYLNVQ